MQCPDPSTQCVGNATHGDALCADGHEGAFCMVCKLGGEGRYVRSGNSCVRCTNESITQLCLAAVAAVLILGGVTCFLIRGTQTKSAVPEIEGSSKLSKQERLSAFADKLEVKYKVQE